MRLSHALIGAALCCAPMTAHAQEGPPGVGPCGTGETVLSSLAERYGEMPMATFEIIAPNSKAPAILVVDPGDGSWTILLRIPSGQLCMIMTGEGFSPAGGTGGEAVKPEADL